MIPGRGVAATGLVKEDFLQVRHFVSATLEPDRGEQRHKPDRAPRQHHQQAGRPAHPLPRHDRHTRPSLADCIDVGHQHQRRQKTDPFADDAQTHGQTGEVEPAPRRAQQQMPDHPVEAERDPQAQEAVDLPGAQDAVGLIGRQKQQRGNAAHPAAPQPPAQVVQHRRSGRRREQARDKECQRRRTGQPGKKRHRPHEQRRLVAVDFTGPMGDQPAAAVQHFQRDAQKSFFVDIEGLPDAKAGTDQNQRKGNQRQTLQRGRLKASHGLFLNVFVFGNQLQVAQVNHEAK